MKNKKRIYGYLALSGIAIVILIELLVITQILPFNVICGGTLESYQQAVILAIGNIISLLILATAIMISSGIIQTERFYQLPKIILQIFSVYFGINIIMNLMGQTWLERILGSILALLEIFCYLQILKKD